MGNDAEVPTEKYFEHYYRPDSLLNPPDHDQLHPFEKVIILTFETTVSLVLIYILYLAIANST